MKKLLMVGVLLSGCTQAVNLAPLTDRVTKLEENQAKIVGGINFLAACKQGKPDDPSKDMACPKPTPQADTNVTPTQ